MSTCDEFEVSGDLLPHLTDSLRNGDFLMHTTLCVAGMEDAWRDYDGWHARYDATYCRACQAQGLHFYPGTLYEPPDVRPCPACTGGGACPQCRAPFDLDGQEQCSCGWHEGMRAPDEPVCVCWMDEDGSPIGEPPF